MAQPLATLYAHSLGWHGLLWCKHPAEIYTLKAEMALSVHFYHRINYNLQTSSGKYPFDSIKNSEDKIRWNSRKVGHGGLANQGDLHAMLVASVHTAELRTVPLCTKPAEHWTGHSRFAQLSLNISQHYWLYMYMPTGVSSCHFCPCLSRCSQHAFLATVIEFIDATDRCFLNQGIVLFHRSLCIPYLVNSYMTWVRKKSPHDLNYIKIKRQWQKKNARENI